jgi:hypothetical protein
MDVFHFGETRWISKKKNAVAATSAIEIIQNVTPTKSSAFRSPPPAANTSEGSANAINPIKDAFDINLRGFILIIFIFFWGFTACFTDTVENKSKDIVA